MKTAIIVVSIILGICLLPLAIPLLALVFAELAGCVPDGDTPCMVAGNDLKETLYIAVMIHWLGLMTLPFAGLAGVLLITLLIVRAVRRRKQK